MQHVPHYLRELNPAQRQAALATEGPVLILAGAGSGKTRTLVFRISHLIQSGVDPRRILAVTFTNKAANEMRERVAHVVGKDARGVLLSTFHSLGARILREHGARLGLPKSFSIYSTGEQTSIVKRIIDEEVHVVATAGDDKYDHKQVLFQISDWKNRMVMPEEAAKEVAEGRMRNNRKDDYAVLASAVYPRYEQALRAAGATDFDDLLLLPVKLLRESAEVREAMWKRWHYLMIDEYQDTNGAQLEMARLLSGPRQNLCVVGDDDQSIYAWRGADVRNILDFERHFPGAQVVILEENYRSTQRILDAANAVIANNTARKEKRLRCAGGTTGPKIDLWEFQPDFPRSAEECEAEMVAREIGVRRFTEKLKWSDFAVLYRTNLQARPLEEALRATNVPYRVVGGTSYFDRKEVADAVAYMRVVVNPKDEVSLRRVLAYQKGVGRTTILKLVDEARASGRPLWHVLLAPEKVDGLGRAQAEAVRPFVEMIDDERAAWEATEAAIEGGSPGERTLHAWAQAFVKRLRLEEAIRRENQTSERATEVRIEILRDFVDSIRRFEERAWAAQPLPDEEDDWVPPTLAAFLERVSLIDEDDKKEDKDEDPDRVTLLTLHSAKGLEYAHVFLVGLEEEILPHSRSVNAVADDTGLDPIAEERRLFYVGVTRARHRLTLSGCAVRGGGKRKESGKDEAKAPRSDFLAEKPRQPSRFLQEIPPDLLEHKNKNTGLSAEESQALRQNFSSSWREALR